MKAISDTKGKELKKLISKFENYYVGVHKIDNHQDAFVALAASLFRSIRINKAESIEDRLRVALRTQFLGLDNFTFDLSQCFSVEEISFLKDNYTVVVDMCLNFYDHDKTSLLAGEFVQPIEVTQACLKIANFKDGSEIYNPFAGLASYPVFAPECHFSGEEVNLFSWLLSLIYMDAHNTSADIRNEDSFINLISKKNKYDGAVTTPPFGLNSNGKTELDAIRYILENKLKKNGTLVAVLPTSFLFSTALRMMSVKTFLLEKGYLQKVITLPPRLFHPVTSVSTCIIVAKKSYSKNVLLVDGMEFLKEESGKSRNRLDTDRLLSAISSESPDYCVRVSNNDLLQTRIIAPTIYMRPNLKDGYTVETLGSLVENMSQPIGTATFSLVHENDAEIRQVAIQDLSISNPNCIISINSLENGSLGTRKQIAIANSIIIAPSDRGLRMGYIQEIPNNMIITIPGNALCLKLKENISLDYQSLLVLLSTNYVSKQVSKLFLGFARGFLNWSVLSNVLVTIPPKEDIEKLTIDFFQDRKTAAEQKLERAMADYETEIHSRKHAMSQTLSSVSALWNTLNRFRKANGGSLQDSLIVSKVTNSTVAELFDAITYRLETLLVQTDNLADVNYNWGPEEHISTELFIRDYIERHKDVRFQLLQDYYEPVIARINENDEAENLLGIIFPKRALEHVFDNIISNAVSHGFVDSSRTDYKILFSEVVEDIDRYIIRVSNNGNPLPVGTDPEEVFVYGYSTSLNASTHDGKKHHGLGGYDLRNILKKYSADVKIISSPDEEYTVTYELIFTKTDLSNE